MECSRVKVVLLTSNGLEHRYVAAAIESAYPAELAGIITAAAPASRIRLLRWWRRYSISQLASRVAARMYRRRHHRDEWREAALARVLFADDVPEALPRPDLQHVVPTHNHDACISLLARIQPDVIVVYGTGLIGRRVIAAATRGIVNMHTGLSPWYRGSDSVFWALHNQEPEKVGATVHLVSENLDAGAVLHTTCPTIEPDDDEDSLFAKCVRAGTALLVEAVREIAESRVVPIPQDLALGREYRFVDRTASAERRVAGLLLAGLLSRRL